ncbi:MAG TPA: response regulator [Burkholderiaceae bacterium]
MARPRASTAPLARNTTESIIVNADVLILDPAADAPQSLSGALTGPGFDLRVARDSNAALAAMRASPPELILIDASRGLEGVEACRALRAAPHAATIPTLLVGPFDAAGALALALAAGANDVLRTPYTPELLRARVRVLLSLARAESAHRASSALLANVGHEVRTAIPAILGMSNLALQSGLDARQRQYVELAARSGELLLDTLNDILDYSTLSAARPASAPSAFSLAEVLDSVAKLVALKADAKGLELLFDLPADLPPMLVGDAGRLRRVLIDLATRAVRAAPCGEIVIGIQRVAHDGTRVRLRFSVHATGAPAPGDTPPAARAAPEPAQGLGFEISRHLIGLMGSALDVEGDPKRVGPLSFSVGFELPPGVPAPWLPLVSGNARVLVVDDNASARGVLAAMCGSLGLQADAVADGWDALRAVEMSHRAGRPYALVLLDAAMPTMDGPECVRMLMRGEARPPVVMMVGMFEHEEVLSRLAANRATVRSLLTKPVMPGALREAYAGATLLKPDAPARPPAAADPLADHRHAQLHGTRVLLVDDNHIIQELALELLRGAGMVVTPATNGREALECLAAGSFDLVLMDCQMPVMDGFEATRAIRAQAQYAELPVIALTAGLADADRDRVVRSGMNDIIPKPIDVDQMFATLARWLNHGSAPAPAARVSGDPLTQLPGIDARIGRASTMNNDTLYRRLLGMFRDGQRNFPSQFRSARAAGDLVTATRLVHNLRAVSGSLGAVAVQNAAMTLEGACTVNANDQAITDLLETVILELDPVLASLAELAP